MSGSAPFAAAVPAIQAHARAEYPRESCGFIVGGEYVPQTNVAADPLTGFAIADAAYLAHAGRIEAVVHSHPDGPLGPSRADMDGQLATDVPWGIVTVTADGRAGEPVWWGDSLPIAPLVGRPYIYGVWDCYTVVRDYYRLERGVLLPPAPRMDKWWKAGGDMFRQGIAAHPELFRELRREEVRPGDWMVFRIKSEVPNHAAVYLGDGLMLHHPGNQLSRKEEASRWMRYVAMYVRVTG